jgi:hypothetical protein
VERKRKDEKGRRGRGERQVIRWQTVEDSCDVGDELHELFWGKSFWAFIYYLQRSEKGGGGKLFSRALHI